MEACSLLSVHSQPLFFNKSSAFARIGDSTNHSSLVSVSSGWRVSVAQYAVRRRVSLYSCVVASCFLVRVPYSRRSAVLTLSSLSVHMLLSLALI